MPNRLATWRHPVIEGLAVLLGILVAFGIDAWWQERTDRATERELLSALAAELRDARDGFESHAASLDAEFDVSADVVRVLGSPDHASSRMTPCTFLRVVWLPPPSTTRLALPLMI